MNQMFKRPDKSTDQFNHDAARSYTLPGWMYHDAQVLEDEKRAIFERSWNHVGHAAELQVPGDYVTAEIVGQRVFVICDAQGDLRAFFNVCQHRGHSLLKGKGQRLSLS